MLSSGYWNLPRVGFIASEKSHTVHPNKLEKRYTLIPMTIHIVKYLGGDIVKLVDFSRLVFFFKDCLTAFCEIALNSTFRRLLPYCKVVGYLTENIQEPTFSILLISLQQIEYEKIQTVHSNMLGESYTLKPTTIFIVKCWGATL